MPKFATASKTHALSFLSPIAHRILSGGASSRAQRRVQGILTNGITSILARSLSVLATFFSIPLTIRYLGSERFGMWMTISSTVAMLGFLDLGVGQGLINVVTDADARQDQAGARRAVSSGFFLLMFIALLGAVLFAAMYPFVPWAHIFNVSTRVAADEAAPTAAVLAGCFLVSLPLSVVRQVQLGYQEGFKNDLWQSGGTILGFVALVVAIRAHSSLPWLVLALIGAPHFSALVNSVYHFGITRPWLRPAVPLSSGRAAMVLLRNGLLFTVVNICAAICISADNLIIAHYLGAEAVTQFAVPARLFNFSAVMLSMFLVPLWPAFGEAVASADYGWLRSALRHALVLGTLSVALPSACLVILAAPIIRIWVNAPIKPDLLLCIALAAWTTISQVGNIFSTFLGGANLLAFRVLATVLMTVAATVFKVVLIRALGIAGVPTAMVAAYSLLFFVPSAVFIRRFLRMADKGLPPRNPLWIPPGSGRRSKAHIGLWRYLGAACRAALSPVLHWPAFTGLGAWINNRARRRQERAQSLTTRFFRNPALLEVLGTIVTNASTGTEIRVAVLGCSTGAELYTVAHVIHSSRPDLAATITAVDICPEAIEEARRGMYERTSALLRGVPIELTDCVLEDAGDRLRVKDKLREGIRFLVADVSAPQLEKRIGTQDVVLANNFLIHLDPAQAEACLMNICRLLSPGGYLFVTGVDLDIRSEVVRRVGLSPVSSDVKRLHMGDQLLRAGWPWEYWGLEPFDRSRSDWYERYATVFCKHSRAGLETIQDRV